MLRFAVIQTPFGPLRLVTTSAGVLSLSWLCPPDAAQENPAPGEPDERLRQMLLSFWNEWPHSSGTALNRLPLDLQGTAFQKRVWEGIREIPVGTTITYGALAARLEMPRSSRAVAQACAANRIALRIPCHRVVPAHGGVGGYRWSPALKQGLLNWEALGRE